MAYVEVTSDDIRMANRLAHEVLGRSLDELPPQTRRLLMVLDQMVATECEARGLERTDHRFSRRDLRAFCGWSDTQLKVHLARLVDLEYLTLHRGGRGQGFVYELSWDGRGLDGTPFLPGLVDPDELTESTTTIADRSGSNGQRSGSGRGAVQLRSGVVRFDPENAYLDGAPKPVVRVRTPSLVASLAASAEGSDPVPRRGKGEAWTIPPLGDLTDPDGMGLAMTAYLQAMQTLGRTEPTMRNQAMYLGHFLTWCEDRGVTRPTEVTKPILERFQRHLFQHRKTDGMPLSFRSQHNRLSTIRSFFRWLARGNRILYNPASDLEMPRVERRLPRHVLSETEAELVLQQPDLLDPLGLRDRAILEVLYSTAVRRARAGRAYGVRPRRERGTVMVRQGKGKKDRIVPIGDRAIAWVEKYLSRCAPGAAGLRPVRGCAVPDHAAAGRSGSTSSPTRCASTSTKRRLASAAPATCSGTPWPP